MLCLLFFLIDTVIQVLLVLRVLPKSSGTNVMLIVNTITAFIATAMFLFTRPAFPVSSKDNVPSAKEKLFAIFSLLSDRYVCFSFAAKHSLETTCCRKMWCLFASMMAQGFNSAFTGGIFPAMVSYCCLPFQLRITFLFHRSVKILDYSISHLSCFFMVW